MSNTTEYRCEQSVTNDATIVTPRGSIDLVSGPQFHEMMVDVVGQKPERVIVDLQHVSYMDSLGVGAIVEANRAQHDASRELLVCGMQDQIREVFDVLKLGRVITIVPDLEAAQA